MKPLLTVGALAPRGGLVELHERASPEMCRGVVVATDGEALPTLRGKAAWSRQDAKKSEARRDDTERASVATSAPCPPQPANSVTSVPAKEADMPKGVYPRKKRKARAGPQAAGRPAEQLPRRAREARFGVFEDGAVHINTEGCKGKLTPDEAIDLLHFIDKLAEAGWIRGRGGKGAPKA